jgi:hypothetical protein
MRRLLLSDNPTLSILLGLTIAVALLVTGCDVLEVDNPNNLREEDLSRPVSAGPMANGAEASVTRALGMLLTPTSTTSDELTFIGSRDAWSQLDLGVIGSRTNEFSDYVFPFVGEARWLTDEYIERIEAFRDEGDLNDDRILARVYLYGAIIYGQIADHYDDFVINSSGREGGQPIGPGNMSQLYDTAIQYINRGLELADPSDDADLVTALTALRARTYYSQGLWGKLNPSVDTGDPLVNSQAAVDDALAALDLMDSESYVYELELSGSVPDLVDGVTSMAWQVNERNELGFGEAYIEADEAGELVAVTFEDPVSGEVDPVIEQKINSFIAAQQYANLPIVSAVELRLILAEAALAGNGSAGDFATQINAVRSAGGKADWTAGSGVSEQDILIHERRVNLFLQGRRLADHYRFDDPSPEWNPDAKSDDGTFLPIAITEVRSNPNIN